MNRNVKKILIVDDHPVLRRGLSAIIESDENLEVCAEAGSYETAIDAIRRHQPDLVIIDYQLTGGCGLDLVKRLKISAPEIPALMLSMHDESVYGERCLRAGAKGYVTKQQLDETVLTAIRKVLDGQTFISKSLATQLASQFIDGKCAGLSSVSQLSDRELQVFEQVGHWKTTREISETLKLSIKTIESHIEHIKKKLTLHSASELAQRATQWVERERARATRKGSDTF